MWKTQDGERAPFWCTLLFFTRAGNWIVHVTPSGYVDRDGWFKTMHNFVRQCGATKANPQYLFFDGHDSHWDADALEILNDNHVESFFLMAGNSENDQPNDNGPNACLII